MRFAIGLADTSVDGAHVKRNQTVCCFEWRALTEIEIPVLYLDRNAHEALRLSHSENLRPNLDYTLRGITPRAQGNREAR
jgi:hypothetical protein